MKLHRTNICLPFPSVQRLKELADRKGIKFSELVRRIIDDWLDKNDS